MSLLGKLKSTAVLFAIFGAILAASLCQAQDESPRPLHYRSWFWEVKDPVTGETLYLQKIQYGPWARDESHPEPSSFSDDALSRERIAKYQKMALDHIEGSMADEADRAVLRDHRANIKIPTGMLILSRSLNFDHIASDDIVGTLAITDPLAVPMRFEYKPHVATGIIWNTIFHERPVLHAADQKITMGHFVSLDKKLTPFLLHLSDTVLLSVPRILDPSEEATVKIDTASWPEGSPPLIDRNTGKPVTLKVDAMPMKEFQERFFRKGRNFVFPSAYEADAFDALADYYRGLGWKLVPTEPAHGRLRHYELTREDATTQWIKPKMKDATENWGKLRMKLITREVLRRLALEDCAFKAFLDSDVRHSVNWPGKFVGPVLGDPKP